MKKTTLIYSILFLIMILLMWGFSELWIDWLYKCFPRQKPSSDAYNSVNTLFTGLAFAGLLLTILIQRQEFKEQIRLNHIQNFESNFFSLLEQHHRIIDSFELDVKPNRKDDQIEEMPFEKQKVSKLEAFDYLAKDFAFRFEKVKNIRFPADQSYQTVLVYAYSHHVFGRYGYMLGHYFRNLYHIVKFIDDNEALKEWQDKYKYAKILRAQLSAPEINLLAWNGLSEYGTAFKPLIEKYKLLDNMNLSYEMVNLLWLSTEYPHLRRTVWKANSVFYFGTEFEKEIEEFEKEQKEKN